MATMFGNQRAFGGSLGQSPMQRLGGGVQLGFGGQRFPQVVINEMLGGRGQQSMFGGGGGGMFGQGGNEPSTAMLMNMQSLDKMGDRQFQGHQLGEDRELQRLLQIRGLRNNIDLANIDQGTQFGVQDRRNSGALDQINASGMWERDITGDKLGSNERLAALQRDLDLGLAQGGWNQQSQDRQSREKMTEAELANAIARQQMVGDQQIGAINAQGGVNYGLQQLEGNQRRGDLVLSGQQGMQLQDLVGRQQAGLEQTRGNFGLEGIRMNNAGDNYRTGLTLGTQERMGTKQVTAMLEEARLNNATQRLGIQTGAETAREGYRARAGEVAGTREFTAAQNAAQRTHEMALSAAENLAKNGSPEHRKLIEGYRATEASAQAQLAQAQADMAKAEQALKSDPQYGQALMQRALAETATAQTRLEESKQAVAQMALNDKLIQAQIAKENAERGALENPMRELQGLVDFARQNPGVKVGGDNFSVDPAELARSSTSLNPLVMGQIDALSEQLGGGIDYQVRQIKDRHLRNIPEDEIRKALMSRRRPEQEAPAGPYGVRASDYSPAAGGSFGSWPAGGFAY
jgi:hypothetical protein